MYTEASHGNVGAITSLRSPPVTGYINYCLSFQYHMYGDHVGSLEVVQKYAHRRTSVWRYSGNSKKEDWVQANVQFSGLHTNSTFQVVFTARRGVGYRGDIAIDDVTLTPGTCNLPRTWLSIIYCGLVVANLKNEM